MAAQDNPDSNVSYSLPPFARRWMRLVLGLSVGIGLGLAPFLGKLPVPGFDALLTAFPEDLRLSLIPMSAFLMGSVAVGMQFLYGEHVRRKYLRLGFLIAFAAVMAGFFWLIFIYDSLVAHIDIPATGTARSFVIAPERRPHPQCPCPDHWSDEECIRETFDPGRIERCWGSRELRRSRRLLRSGYLLLTGGFGATIGLLLLQARPGKARSPQTASGPGETAAAGPGERRYKNKRAAAADRGGDVNQNRSSDQRSES